MTCTTPKHGAARKLRPWTKIQDHSAWADAPDSTGAENWHRSVTLRTIEPGEHIITVYVGSDSKATQPVAVAMATGTRLTHASTILPDCQQTQTVRMVIEDTIFHLGDLLPKIVSKGDGSCANLGDITVYQEANGQEAAVSYQYGIFNKRDPLLSRACHTQLGVA